MAIDKLKEASLVLIGFGQKIEVAAKDGFKFYDLLPLLSDFAKVPAVLATKDELVAEFKALDKTGRQDLIDYIDQNLSLTNKKTEAIIQNVLGIVLLAVGLIETLSVHTTTTTVITNGATTPNPTGL